MPYLALASRALKQALFFNLGPPGRVSANSGDPGGSQKWRVLEHPQVFKKKPVRELKLNFSSRMMKEMMGQRDKEKYFDKNARGSL